MQQSNSKREVHRNAGLHQEIKISNKQFNFMLVSFQCMTKFTTNKKNKLKKNKIKKKRKLEKRTKSKVNRKLIIKIRVEINDMEPEKIRE